MTPFYGIQGLGYGSGDILTRAIQLAALTGVALPINVGAGLPGIGGLQGDLFSPSSDIYDYAPFGLGGEIPRFGGYGAGYPAGIGNGMGFIPGFGGLMPGFMNPQQQLLQMLMQIIMMLMFLLQRNGFGGQQPFGGPGQFPGGIPGQSPFGPMGMNPYGGGMGGEIELQKGQTFTTPGGATIKWQGDEVKVHDPGGGGFGGPQGAGQGSTAAAAAGGPGAAAASAAAAPGGIALALVMTMTPFGPAIALALALGGSKDSSDSSSGPKDWKVWGDPHIKSPDGSKSDFVTKNGMFTLSDGTRVLMEANDPKGVVNRVRIFLPGAQINPNTVNLGETTLYRDVNGKWTPAGTLAQFQQAHPALGYSPFGNQLF